MYKHKLDSENRQIKSVTYFGLIVNVVLTLAKVIVGLIVGSMSLVADGIHSLSDMSTDFAVLLGVYLGSKKPDQCHPYGHGRAETFSSGFIAIVLAVVGGAMIYYAAIDIANGNVVKPNLLVLIIAVVSVVSKEYLTR
ncbi:MAG: cation diffusion facilitator family transporter [Candidatus Brocadiia bacterium]|nr:MAG: cation diffusion facilitator family transporter [Candidatus Brocadiia bacterium]